MSITTHTITTKHFPTLSFRRSGEGPALMLLHGFPASGALWDDLLPTLAQKYTVIIPDIPGAGSSRLEGESVTMEQLATIVPAILNAADVERCVLAGHSMGGYISMAAAALFPERLAGLLLIHSTALADDNTKKEKRAKSIALIRKGGQEAFVKGMIPGLFEESYPKTHPEQVEALAQQGLKLPAESMIAFYTAMMNRPDRMPVIAQIAFPAGWIMGAEDATIPWRNTLQQTSVPNVSFVRLYERCGHMSMIEQPDLLCDDLIVFSDYCTQHTEAPST